MCCLIRGYLQLPKLFFVDDARCLFSVGGVGGGGGDGNVATATAAVAVVVAVGDTKFFVP